MSMHVSLFLINMVSIHIFNMVSIHIERISTQRIKLIRFLLSCTGCPLI